MSKKEQTGTETLNLGMTQGKCQKLSELEDKAVEIVLGALNGKEELGDKTKLAMNVVNAVAKNRQTLSHRRAVEVGVARMAFSDDDLQKYLKATAPEIKKLTSAA